VSGPFASMLRVGRLGGEPSATVISRALAHLLRQKRDKSAELGSANNRETQQPRTVTQLGLPRLQSKPSFVRAVLHNLSAGSTPKLP